jgi:hypothetical protein
VYTRCHVRPRSQHRTRPSLENPFSRLRSAARRVPDARRCCATHERTKKGFCHLVSDLMLHEAAWKVMELTSDSTTESEWFR